MCDKKPMELADTAEMMMSKDYKERFRAEYCQVVIRYQKLKAMLEKWDNGELNFTPTCPRSTYNMQIKTADGSHAMWVPSIGDILAEDWQIIQ